MSASSYLYFVIILSISALLNSSFWRIPIRHNKTKFCLYWIETLPDRLVLWECQYFKHHSYLLCCNFFQLSEMVKLRNFHDLQSLTIAGNPLCDLSHHRAYIVFHLRTLDQLDGQNITLNERSAANTRFAQGKHNRQYYAKQKSSKLWSLFELGAFR